MSIERVVDTVALRLGAALTDTFGPGTTVGDIAASGPTDLPRVVLGLREVTEQVSGVGRVPRGTSSGALPVQVRIDLADPVLDLGNGDVLDLLSADRRTLLLPHGPLVTADGVAGAPLQEGDVTASDGAPFTVVTQEPEDRQVAADAVAGTLTFGSELAATGVLTVGYHIGVWDTTTHRMQCLLDLEVLAAGSAEVAATSRAVVAALDPGFVDLTTGLRFRPRGWAPVTVLVLPDGGPPDTGTAVRSQRLTFALDAEISDPVLTTGGGVVARVAVTPGTGPPPGSDVPFEPFDVTQGVPR